MVMTKTTQLTESQKESIRSMRAVRKVLLSYRDLTHPDIGDVIADFDDAFVNFYREFVVD